jgi:hypothetical protein
MKKYDIAFTYRKGGNGSGNSAVNGNDWNPQSDYSGTMVSHPTCNNYEQDGEWFVLHYENESVRHNLKIPGNEVVSVLVVPVVV